MDINKEEVIKLARELLKIRISAAREGPAEDDGVHNKKIKAILFYDDAVMEKWYKEALKTAELIVVLEAGYIKDHDYKHPES